MMLRRFRLSSPTVHKPVPGLEFALAMLVLSAGGILVFLLGSVLAGWSLSPASWYIARASGITLYLLSWLMVMSGLSHGSRFFRRSGSRSMILSLHAYVFHLWYGMLAIHMLSLVADPTIFFGVRELLIPFRGDWREPWTGLGTLAAMGGILVGASAAVRRVLGYRAWKALHWLSLPVFVLALAHGLGAGTDSTSFTMFIIYLVTGGWTLALGLYRLTKTHARAQARAGRQGPPVSFRSPSERTWL
jgi:sulfoxide reductase heme-binding subunit YedZ